jgi:hypothetical protein
MSYATGEALILTLLRRMEGFDDQNSSRQRWKVLNSGASDHYAIVRPGPFTNEPEALGETMSTSWRTVIELWQRWLDDGETTIALQNLMQGVLEHFDGYPRLGDTTGSVVMGYISGGGEMQERWLTQAGPSWAVWEVYVDWQEERIE